jgi:hypothetical protein
MILLTTTYPGSSKPARGPGNRCHDRDGWGMVGEGREG